MHLLVHYPSNCSRCSVVHVVWLLFLIVPCAVQAASSDKSGVKPSVLSLPSGPGSVEGLGESFKPQLNSGTASYSAPFDVLPGRAGFEPQLSLQYDGGNGNGPAGLGWRLNLPSIQRRTDKGLPFYTDYPSTDGVDNDQDDDIDEADEWDTFLDTNGEELIPVADGSFRTRIESGFTRYQRVGDGWLATRRDGIRLYFGTSPGGRIQHEERGTFRWLLEAMEDTNGNRITYTHEGLDGTPQRYCRLIQYNGDMRVELVYASRPDPFVDHRPRFPLLTAFRLGELRMTAGGAPVRTYRLAYAPTSDTQPLSLLTAVTQVGRDGTSTLPPAEFSYTTFAANLAVPVAMPTAPLITLNDGAIDLMDIDADGLPDLLDTRETLHNYFRNLGPDQNGIVRWSARTSMAAQPSLLPLDSNAVQLADLDGDGHAELLKLETSEAQIYRIRDPLTAPAWERTAPILQAYFNFQNPNTRLIDQNNDKRTDVMRTDSSGNVLVWLNLPGGSPDQGNRWSHAFTPVLPNPNLGLDRATTRLADMNGDRIQDLVWIQDDQCIWYPGQGFGEYGPPVPMANPPSGVIDQRRLVLADVNGDGLGDALLVRTGAVLVWLNLGLDPADLSRGRFAEPFTVSAPYSNTNTVFRQADINGNGSQDILWNTNPGGGSDTFAFLDFAPGEQPYLLKRITNGIGLTTTISYRSSTQDWIRDLDAGQPWPQAVPLPLAIIGRVETNDGLATYVTDFQYHEGYYDGQEKEFRGFAAAEQREIGDASAPDLVTAYRYDTGSSEEAFKGKPLQVETRDAAGAVFYHEHYDWQVRTLAGGVLDDGRDVVYPYQATKTRVITERGQGTPVELRWDSTYDDYGNLTRLVEHGRLDPGWNDERVTEYRYSAADPSGQSAWLLDRPVEKTLLDLDGTRIAHQRHYYDGHGTLGLVSRGNLTRTEDWVEASHYVVSARKDYDAYGNVVALYDPLWGQQPGHYRELSYDEAYHSFPIAERIHTEERVLTYRAEYDPGLGKVTSSTEFNGHRTAYRYDTFGRLVAIVEPGDSPGYPTEVYDYVLAHDLGDGRLINWVDTNKRETTNGGTDDSRTFFDGLSRKIMTRSEGEEPGQIVVSDTQRFNARGQAWRTYLPYFETGSSLEYVAPSFTSGFVERGYDALGREVRTTQPDGAIALTDYEPLARRVRDEEQSNDKSPHFGAAMRYVEDGLRDDKDAGRLRQVEEIVKIADDGTPLASPVTWTTRYRYDLQDNLTGYTDAQGNQKALSYDGLGRKVFMNDPDRGQMHYAYDAAGNLIRTTDAKNQTIRYAYDGVNRLRAEYYSATSATPDVEYHYDLPAGPLSQGDLWLPNNPHRIMQSLLGRRDADSGLDPNQDTRVDVADVVKAAMDQAGQVPWLQAANTLGALAWVRDQSGEEHLSYDERGRRTWTLKRLHDPVGGLRNFFTGMSYDSMDRITTLTYPDQTRATYAYNNRGLLEAIPGVIDRYDYNPAGQNLDLGLANGVTTTSHYDARLRLAALTSRRQRDGRALQDFRYSFDGVSNIVAIGEGRKAEDLSALGAELGLAPTEAARFNVGQNFNYDSLYRLTQASNPAIYGTIDYRYDRIGNLLRQQANLLRTDPAVNLGAVTNGGSAGTQNRVGRQAGDPPGPHALTAAESPAVGTLAYDDNGNVRQEGDKTLSWDAKDHLVGLASGHHRASYTYDYTDTRKIKQVVDNSLGASDTTLYIDQFSELRNGYLIKYLYAGAHRVARSFQTGCHWLSKPAHIW